MTTEQLLDLKQDIEDYKVKASELTGQLKGLQKQMKDDFNCLSLEEAKAKLAEMEDTMKSMDAKIQKGLQKLEDEYNIAE